MAKHVKGNSVANATSYELYEKASGNYTKLAEKNVIDFDLSQLNLASGDHTLVVKAKASGYEDSEYSNEVTYTASDESQITWIELPVTKKALGVTSTGTGRVSENNAKRFSTADDTKANGILIPAGKTLHLKGLASGTYPLRFDYIYGTNNVSCPVSGSTTSIEGLVGTASNYVSSNYFPLNTSGNDTCDVTNAYGQDYYFWFGFAGQTLNESILSAFDTYDIKYYIS